MKGFRKMSEEEQLISTKSIKIAHAFTVVFLFVWTILDFINKKTISTAFFLLITQNLVLLFSQMYLKKKI